MKVQEVMTKKVIVSKISEKIIDASKKLEEYNISGLPVVDEKGKLVGIFSRTDLIKLLAKRRLEEINNLTLKDFLKKKRKKLIFVKPDESIENVVKLLYNKKIDRVPVVDNNMHVIGIISKTDLIKIFIEKTEKSEEDKISSLLDKIMEILEKEEKISVKDLAKKLQVDEGTIERIVSILEKNKIVEVNYSIGGTWIRKK